MQYIGIIPARYQSTRFPGKPLVDIEGKPMIQRTWEQACQALDHVVVATDDERIENAVAAFGGAAVITSPDHQTGTERCAEAAGSIAGSSGTPANDIIIINIQGDEPFIRPEQIKLLAGCFDDSAVQIATLAKRIETTEDILNPNLPKVVFSKSGFAIYFSRSPIPYVREKEVSDWPGSHAFYRHIGMYAYRLPVLLEISRLSPTPLETAESLEQVRWLENGYRIKVLETDLDTLSVDTPEDLDKILKYREHR